MRTLKSLFQRLTIEPAIALEDLGVLVVDDESSILAYAEMVLGGAGYRPVLASSGAEALRIAATMTRLDLLVTDLLMPSMTGDELARQLRLRDRDLKVLYQTGFSDRLFAEKVVLWAGEAFVEKPYSTSALKQAVSLLLFDHLERPDTPCLADDAAASGETR
jgi:two-component system, cell cycle sensor histidine kinase and response regulator CckA